MVLEAVKVALDPSPAQERLLLSHAGAARFALSRKVKGSKRCAKARAKVARIHAHVANQRLDAIYKATTWLAETYSEISIEDLNAAINIRVAGSAPETVNARGGTRSRSNQHGCATQVPTKCEPSVGGNVVSDLEPVPARTPCKLQQSSLQRAKKGEAK